MAPRRARAPRGAAITEFALVLPMLISILLFGMFFTELVRAKLKLLEASRFITFEMTSFTLDDYGGSGANRHDVAFAEARGRVLTAALQKFSDLDSVDDRPQGGLVAGYGGFNATVQNNPVAMFGNFDTQPLRSFGGRFVSDLLGALTGSATQAHQHFELNTKGQVGVDVEIVLDNRMLPRHFLDGSRGFFTVDQWGGSSLQQIRLHSRMQMIASGWQLTDGADAQMEKDEAAGGKQAGVHRTGSIHGMWLQVDRMTHLKRRLLPQALPGVDSIYPAITFLLPQPFSSTFVTAHNYGNRDRANRNCDNDPSHPAPEGMNNLDEASALDYPYRKCYDTAPFRDQAGYDSSDGSLSVKVFEARGQHFMGCQNAQADDPTHAGTSPLLNGDSNNREVACGGEVR